MRFAVSATGAGKESRLGDTLTLELGDCVGDIAKSEPSLLPLLIAPLHDKPDASCSESPDMDIAALAWSRIGTTQGQVEIAEHLARHVATGHSCSHAHRFWALARLTSQLKSATPKTMDLLLASASNAVPGTSPDGLVSDEVSSSLRALAALRDPRGDEILRKAQRTDGCSGMPDQLPPFVHPMKDYNPLYHEKTLGKEGFRSWPRCWAALALRSRH